MFSELSVLNLCVSQSSTFNSSERNGLPGDVAGLIRAEECHCTCTLIRLSYPVAMWGGGGKVDVQCVSSFLPPGRISSFLDLMH